jgi:hypothetical protein
MSRTRAFQLLMTMLVAVAAIAPFDQAAGWFDDFNDGNVKDGNPVTWLEDLGGSGFFPGIYDATSGDYLLDPDPGSPTGQMSALVPAQSFTDTYMRTQGIVLPDPDDPANSGGNLVLTARIDPDALTGYLVYFDVSGNLQLQTLIGPETHDIGTTDYVAPFNAGSEVVLELNVVGNELSAYVWLADDPNGKPAEPQVTATDDLFASGMAGIAYAEDDLNTSAIYRFAAAQSTPFVDTLPGDFNSNGVVDAADYVAWRNGAANPADYNTWRAKFGAGASAAGLSAGASSTAVPEPAGWICALLAIGGCLARSRSSRSMTIEGAFTG